MKNMSSGETSPIFAGRDAELALLKRTLDLVADGTAGTVLVVAEADGGVLTEERPLVLVAEDAH